MKKITVWVLGAGVVLLIVAALAYSYAAKKDFYFNEINELVQTTTGYTVEKSNPLALALFPRPKLTARNLIVTNPAANSNNVIAKIKRLSFKLHWTPLLQLKFVTDVELEAPDINLQIDTDGQSNWMTEELLTITGGLPIDLDKVDAWEVKFLYTDHQKNEILGLDLAHFDIDLAAGETRARIDSAGRFGDSRFLAVGDAEYKSENNHLALRLALGAGEAEDIQVSDIEVPPSVTTWIEQNAASFPLHGLVEGVVSIEDRVPHGKLTFKANATVLDEFRYLVDELSYLRDGIGPVSANGEVILNGSDFDLQNLNVELHHEQTDIVVGGNINNLLSQIELDLKTRAQTDGLNKVVTPGAIEPFDRLGPVEVSASITKKGNDIRVSDLDLDLVHNTLTTRMRGDMHFTETDTLFSVEHRSEAVDSGDLFQLLGIDHPSLVDSGTLKLTSRISGNQDSYKIEEAEGELQDGNVKTSLDGELKLIDQKLYFDIDGSLTVNDLSRVAVFFPKDTEPYLEKLSGTLKTEARGTLDDFSLDALELDLTREDRELHFRGNLSQLPNNVIADVDCHFLTESPVELDQYFSKLENLQLVGPLDLAGKVKAVDNKIRVQSIRLQAEQTDVEGGIFIDLNTTPPEVFVVVDSRNFFTRLIERDPEAKIDDAALEAEIEEQPKPELSEKELSELFKAYTKSIAIETDWIKDLSLYLNFTADRAQIGAYNMEGLVLTVDVREGVLSLVEYEIILDGKPISFNGSINTTFTPPTYEVAGKLEGDTLEALLNVEESNLFVGGELSGDFNLKSQGNTLGEVIENLNGKALVSMGPLTIKSRALSVVSSDMLSSMLRGIVSTKKDEPSSSYECGVLGVDVDKGVARVNRSFAMQARDYNLAGKGEIDLNSGYLDIAVYPKARRGLGLSVSTLVGGFKINGHLATPRVGVRGGGFLTAMLTGYALTPTAAAATASNPVTATIVVTGFVAKGIFDRLTASNYTCENTLQRIQRNQSRPPRRPGPQAPKMHF
ncbi:MAG: AsmA family protein [Arenicellales bacterium]|nr:AsmA family protein [Arenicellales bacterium]